MLQKCTVKRQATIGNVIFSYFTLNVYLDALKRRLCGHRHEPRRCCTQQAVHQAQQQQMHRKTQQPLSVGGTKTLPRITHHKSPVQHTPAEYTGVMLLCGGALWREVYIHTYPWYLYARHVLVARYFSVVICCSRTDHLARCSYSIDAAAKRFARSSAPRLETAVAVVYTIIVAEPSSSRGH